MRGSRAKKRQGGCRPPAPHGVAQVLWVEEVNETQRLYWRGVCVRVCVCLCVCRFVSCWVPGTAGVGGVSLVRGITYIC